MSHLAVSPRLCPNCDRPARLLADLSKELYVEYYRCDACDHVWPHSRLAPVPEAGSASGGPDEDES
jgi:hypothetical protein